MDRSVTDICMELGVRLATLDESVAADAFAENPWFGATDIRLAARNTVDGMLSRDVLSGWLSLYPTLPVTEPRNVLIIMAGNIPFVGMQDLLCVVAAGHRAIVKPSSKDSVLMSWVVKQLSDIAPELPVVLTENSHSTLPTSLACGDGRRPVQPPDAVIAMGGNQAIAAIREKYPDIPLLLRGNRSSAAVLDGRESPGELAALADDILTCSGLGCRNVSLVFVPRSYDFSKLQYIMSERTNKLNIKYRNNYRQARAMLVMNSVPHIDCGACLLVEKTEFPSSVSCINYAYYDSLHEVIDWMSARDVDIQCVAANYQFLRTVAFGQTQRPTLSDYPDGRDTMQFLMTI